MGNVIYGIITGFVVGGLLGTALGAVSFKERFLEILFKPAELLLGLLPELCILLAFIFRNNDSAVFCVCLIAAAGFLYARGLKELKSTDDKLMEMAHIFRIPADRQLQYIYLPQIRQGLIKAIIIGLVRCAIVGAASGIICSIF
jgi:NitT/TauT family transport system permease protein